jgi:hypothetical protein
MDKDSRNQFAAYPSNPSVFLDIDILRLKQDLLMGVALNNATRRSLSWLLVLLSWLALGTDDIRTTIVILQPQSRSSNPMSDVFVDYTATYLV